MQEDQPLMPAPCLRCFHVSRCRTQMGTVAVPGGELVYNMAEPVAIVIPNEDLNIQMPNNEVRELSSFIF